MNGLVSIININKPILLHGYNRGAIYNELDGKYYDYYVVFKNNMGIWSVFASLAIFLNSTNDIYTIYDLLIDEGTIEDCVSDTQYENLWILPSPSVTSI